MSQPDEAKPARSMDELVAEMYTTLRDLAESARRPARAFSLTPSATSSASTEPLAR